MKRYKDVDSGKMVVEVRDLSFLKNPDHPYGWFHRHFLHCWLKWALNHSDIIRTYDQETAFDIHRFYFITKDRIEVVK